MKTVAITVIALLPWISIQAEEETWIRLSQPKEDRNRVRAGGFLWFNAKIEYESKGRSSGTAQAGPATGGADHIYHDGYNRVDGSGNAFPPGSTSFWGYDNSAQLFDSPTDPTVGIDSIAMHIEGFETSTQNWEDSVDPQPGLELAYSRVLGQGERRLWGLEGILGYLDWDEEDRHRSTSQVSSLTDVYSLTVRDILVTAPTAPYAGPFSAAPGSPLIGDTPTRTMTTSSGTLDTRREFEGEILAARVGPFIEFALSRRFNLAGGVGIALLLVDSRFRYDDTLSYMGSGGPVTDRRRGSSDEHQALLGGYVDVRVRYDFTPDLGLYVSANYVDSNNLQISEGGQQATLQFSESFLCSAGLSWAF